MDKLRLMLVVVVVIGYYCTLTTTTVAIRLNKMDNSIGDYQTKRTCWWNESCKKEFQQQFECRCPRWSFCRGPGRYYNAFCSFTATGYVWEQRDYEQ